MKHKVINIEGKEVDNIELHDKIFMSKPKVILTRQWPAEAEAKAEAKNLEKQSMKHMPKTTKNR